MSASCCDLREEKAKQVTGNENMCLNYFINSSPLSSKL